MKKIIHDGDAIPWGYRIAYRDVLSWHAVAYPIGIHLIARLVRRVWELSFRYRPSALENLITQATEAEIERRIKAGTLRRGFDLLMKQFCDLHFGSTLKRPPGVVAFPPINVEPSTVDELAEEYGIKRELLPSVPERKLFPVGSRVQVSETCRIKNICGKHGTVTRHDDSPALNHFVNVDGEGGLWFALSELEPVRAGLEADQITIDETLPPDIK